MMVNGVDTSSEMKSGENSRVELSFIEMLDNSMDDTSDETTELERMVGPIEERGERCCFICNAERNRRADATLLQLRTVGLQEHGANQQQQNGCANQVQQCQDECGNQQLERGDCRKQKRQVGGLVSLYPCNNQVVVTVNAPVGIDFSLDYLPKQPENHPGWIACANNGLLLCTLERFIQNQFYICNPLTKECVTLPPPPSSNVGGHLGFLFYPCCSLVDSAHELLKCTCCRYEVIRFPQSIYASHQAQSEFEMESLSSEIGEWSTCTVSSSRKFSWSRDPDNFSPITYKGHLLWLKWGTVMVYDPKKKKLGTISEPKRTQQCRTHHIGCLGISGGSVWLGQFSPLSGFLRVWQLKGGGFDDDDKSGNLNLDECYWSAHRLCDFTEIKGGPLKRKFDKIIGFHPHDPDIVYMQLTKGRRSHSFISKCNLRNKTAGRAILETSCFRFRSDILTLVLPSRSTKVLSTSP